MLTGSCLCGQVRYAIDGKIGPAGYCHCSQCRKANGSAFAAIARVRTKYLRWLSGKDTVREYESSPGKLRAFCSHCGSPMYSRRTNDPDAVLIRLGSLDGDPERRPLVHFWVSAKAPWFTIADDLPQFERELPPDAAKR